MMENKQQQNVGQGRSQGRPRPGNREPRPFRKEGGKKPGMETVKIKKKWETLQPGDILRRPDGVEVEVMAGFSPDNEFTLLQPKNGQGRCKVLSAVVKGYHMPEFEVQVPAAEAKAKPQSKEENTNES